MSTEATFEPRITALEAQVYGNIPAANYEAKERTDYLELELNRLIEKVAALEANDCGKVHIQDLQWMLEQKLDFALREIRNAALDGSLTEMSEKDFAGFIRMVSRTDEIPF